MKHHSYHVYIICNFKRTVLYTGVTNDLETRLLQHYANRGKQNSFAGKYHCYYLIHAEEYQFIDDAIEREKEIKKWGRPKKKALIELENPKWRFLNRDIFGEWPIVEK